ncbi:SAC3/GANP/Nin1/mts3/eIF-3 p25 family-domain-containing protein [Auriculariales sp. MPI-PUGE-AT-0066]|nr:SAC3/GANP/Nin1/mts3/eIF-3 p25 family-domain-containing protein [Auriculariales sp. MPI-PUGE-AT-0066]
MNDPYKPVRLADAITMVGECMDMCPVFERHEREFQNNVDRWEAINPDAKPRRINHELAVKAFQRATQGSESIPSDLRPLPVLQKTLNYLFHTLLGHHGLDATRKFIWDRTRAIRKEFTIQQLTGPPIVEMLERIARYHCLCLFRFSHLDEDNFSIKHEREQLDKSLQSLMELYDDNKKLGHVFPNEAEFVAFRDARPAFYGAFQKIRASKTALLPNPGDPSEVNIIDGFYQPIPQSSLPPSALAGIPMQASLGAAPGSYTPTRGDDMFTTSAGPSGPQAPVNIFASVPTSVPTKEPAAATSSIFGTSSFFGGGTFPQSYTAGSSSSAFPSSAPASTVQFPSVTFQSSAAAPVPAFPSLSFPGSGFPSSAPVPVPSTEAATAFPSSAPRSELSASTSTPSQVGSLGIVNALVASVSSSTTWPGSMFSSAIPTSSVQPATEIPVEVLSQRSIEAKRLAALEANAEAAARETALRQAAMAKAKAEYEAAEQRRREEQARSAEHEQSLKQKLRERAENERRKRLAEEESEANRLAQAELEEAAEFARRQHAADEIARVEQDERMRLAEMPLKADSFYRARALRRCWRQWLQRAVAVAMIAEQEEKLKRRREEFSQSIRNLVAGGGSPTRPSSHGLRVRPRTSIVSAADQATALQKESEQHAKLWAPNTFAACLQQHLGGIPLWEVWVSPASLEGASSGWLRTKFGVFNEPGPLHRLSLFTDISKEFFSSPSSPGLIIFEPSDNPVADQHRLRTIVGQIPTHAHFSPSLLLVKFSGPESAVGEALKSSIQALGKAGNLRDARVLVVSTTDDIDKQFLHAVSSLNLDTTGSLVQKVNLTTFVNTILSAWEVPLRTWIGLCNDAAGFNWQLYGAVATAMLGMLNDVSHHISVLASRTSSSLILPPFHWDDAADASSAFEAAREYLNMAPLSTMGEARVLDAQLAEAALSGSEFPIYALPERVGQMVANYWRGNSRLPSHVYLPQSASFDSITQELRDNIHAQLLPLSRLIRYNAPSPPPSPTVSSTVNGMAPKKRTVEDMQWDEDADFIMNTRTSPVMKRPKVSNGDVKSTTNGGDHSPPSPAMSTISLMSTSSVGGSKRGARLRALMDKMRASLTGDNSQSFGF